MRKPQLGPAEPLERVGPFELMAPLPHWGSGFFVGRRAADADDDLPARVVFRVALPGESLFLALEGARRMRLASPYVPLLVRRGDDRGRTWLAFQPVIAVSIELVLDEPLPVPLALELTVAFARTMIALEHARQKQNSDHELMRTPIAPSFAELLVDVHGQLLMLTPPPGTRMTLPGLLKLPRRDRALLPSEGVSGHERGDVFVVGAFLRQLLTAADAHDGDLDHVPGRVRDLVLRAVSDPSQRFESIGELAGACVQAGNEWPPLETSERAAFVRARAGWRVEEAERSFT